MNTGEIETLTEYLRRFEISAAEYEQLRPLIETPLTPAEATELLEEQLGHLTTNEERGALLAAVKDLFLVTDDELTTEESEFLGTLKSLTSNASTSQLFVSRLRALWSVSPRRKAKSEGKNEAADRFLRKRLLEYFRREIIVARAQRGKGIDDVVSDEELYRVVIWAGLLSSVAHADKNFCPNEEEELLRQLAVGGDFPEPDLVVVVKTYREGGLESIDLPLLVREFAQLASMEDAGRLLDCLFLVAAADGTLADVEVKLIKQIAMRLGFSDSTINGALSRGKRRIETGWN